MKTFLDGVQTHCKAEYLHELKCSLMRLKCPLVCMAPNQQRVVLGSLPEEDTTCGFQGFLFFVRTSSTSAQMAAAIS